MAYFRITHTTRYTYIAHVTDSANQLLLYPITDSRQELKRHKMEITSDPLVEVYEDYFGNRVGFFTIPGPHSELVIRSEIEVITSDVELPTDESAPEEQWEKLALVSDQVPFIDFLAQETFETAGELQNTVDEIKRQGKTPFELGKDLSGVVYETFEYKKGITSVLTSIDEVWKLKAGVCQDFAHVLLVMLRMADIPARYVSGYICPKNHDLRGEGATHAWVEAYIPNYGWIGLDPTNNCVVNDRHVRLALGRNFTDCTPVKGTYKGPSEHSLEVAVTIENGSLKKKPGMERDIVYNFKVSTEEAPANSYQLFLEMQQQQQQQ